MIVHVPGPTRYWHWFSERTVNRGDGRYATAVAAYRSASRIHDRRTAQTFDYRHIKGVMGTALLARSDAPAWSTGREELWNKAELAERRPDSIIAREFVVELPAELPESARADMALRFARDIVDRHGVAVDLALHSPNRRAPDKYYHAHVLMSTRRLSSDGFVEKIHHFGGVRRWTVLMKQCLLEQRWRHTKSSEATDYWYWLRPLQASP